MNKQFKKSISYFLIVVLVLSFFNYKLSYAASLTTLSDALTRNKISTLSDHTIKYRQITQLSSGTIGIDFNTAGFDDGTVDYTDIDLFYGSSQSEVNGSCSTNCTNATLASSAGAGAWGAVFATNALTLSYPTSAGTAINANDYIRIEIGTSASGGDQQITNPGSTGSKVISIVSGADDGNIAVVILTNDQVGVSATVQPTISFSVSDISIGAGDIDTANIYYATSDTNGSTSEPSSGSPSLLTASTNAVNGLSISIKSNGDGSSNAGIYSSTLSDLIEAAASTAVSANSDGYGVYGKSATSLTIAEGYDNDSNSDAAITRSFTTFLSTTSPVSGGTADLSIKMGVGATTKAGAYTDTLTLVCLGNF
ncbi:MAG: hypothetical protein ACD_58C00224G0003 [uncultured bacterium]|nr:MAG: hypothetical protein ACD_58C00224G0003 [uncultured bacterium]